jgi:hypothetical protein
MFMNGRALLFFAFIAFIVAAGLLFSGIGNCC